MHNIRTLMQSLVLAGVLLVCPLYPARAEECQLKLIASLDMIDNPYGVVLVPVTIADTPQIMQLDTGSFSGTIQTDVVDALKLKHLALSPTMLIYTTGGGKFQHYVVLPSLGIGPMQAKNVEFLLTERKGDDKTVAGVLASDILRNFDVELDFAKKKVNLFSPDHCKGQVVYWARSYVALPVKISSDGVIRLQITLDGHDLDGVFVTGENYSTLSLRIAQRIFNVDTASPDVARFGEGTSFPYYRTNFKRLSLQGLSVPNPNVYLIPDAVYESARRDIPDKEQNMPGIDMPHMSQFKLGLDVIRQLHVYIAYREKMLYITSADAH